MDPLDFLQKEELIRFFHCKKTEMSCMEPPHIFLHQLRDHNLVPEDLYKKVLNMKSKERRKDGVYKILDLLEREKSDSVPLFWECVFQDHILQLYPVLRLLRNSLLDGSYRTYAKLPEPEEITQMEKQPAKSKGTPPQEKKTEKKRKKSADLTDEDEQPGPSSLTALNQRKPTKKLMYSPIKKGDKQPIWTWQLYKKTLPVTCGSKKGTLNRDKLATGEQCIFSEKKWFSPNEFEIFGGKARCKNWKVSIRCSNTPLQKIIEEGHLNSPRQKRRCIKNLKMHVSISSSESSRSESSVEMESSDEEVLHDESREGEEEDRGEIDEEIEEEIGEGDEEEETGPVDLSLFEAPSLPVSCGSVNGVLYKSRFVSGSRSKSIRTEERWFTPQEFVTQVSTLIDGHWKKDILCHGKTFNYLLKKKLLILHSLLCGCPRCHIKNRDQLEEENDDECYICNRNGKLVCCDECPRSFHDQCHLPAVQDDSLGEKWMCTFCVLKTNQSWWVNRQMTQEEVLNHPISNYYLHCQYLLLRVYKEDAEQVFSEDPRGTVPDYQRVISEPMWFNRVKTKLQSKEYSTVGQFLSDVRLIFENCHIFNKDNEFDRMGSSLSELFEKEFQTIFNIQ